MVHPFFDEIRDPSCRFPDSRNNTGVMKELPNLFDFNRHGERVRSFILGGDDPNSHRRTLNRPCAQRKAGSRTRQEAVSIEGSGRGQFHTNDKGRDASASGLARQPLSRCVGSLNDQHIYIYTSMT